METTLPPDTVPPVLVTVMEEEEETGPLKPWALAVITALPALTAVTRPEPLTVATPGVLELQVAVPVTFWVLACDELPKVPVAVSWAVWPAVRDCVDGDTEIESSPVGLPQPVNGTIVPMSSKAPNNERSRIVISRRFRPAAPQLFVAQHPSI